MEHTTRRAPHMERYTKVTPWPTDEHPEGHKLHLQIDNQGFLLSNGVDAYYETKKQAEWARDMLCIALDTLIKEHQPDGV